MIVEEKEKRPPIDVEEMFEKQKKATQRTSRPRAEKGKLTYLDGRGRLPPKKVEELPKGKKSKQVVPEPNKKRFSVGGAAGVLLAIVVSVALAAFMLYMFAPTKVQYNALVNEYLKTQKTVDVILGQVGDVNQRLESLITTSSQYVKAGELADILERLKKLEGVK